jgi:polyphosphate kinase
MNDMSSLDNEELIRRITRDIADSYDEELELETEDRHPLPDLPAGADGDADKVYRQRYFGELFRLQAELVKLQDWVVEAREKVVILFEGRDAAGKGSAIKRITQRLNPRVCSGTSNATCRIFRRPAKSSCSTAAGTTAPAWSG